METPDYQDNHVLTVVATPLMETPAMTPQQRYRQSEKCRSARDKYYETKGKETAHKYYMNNRDKILTRSKERYAQLRQMLDQVQADFENDLT